MRDDRIATKILVLGFDPTISTPDDEVVGGRLDTEGQRTFSPVPPSRGDASGESVWRWAFAFGVPEAGQNLGIPGAEGGELDMESVPHFAFVVTSQSRQGRSLGEDLRLIARSETHGF